MSSPMRPEPTRLLPLCAAAALLCLAALGSQPADRASAQTAQPSPHINGTWRPAIPMPRAQQTIQAAVNPVVARLAPNMREMARARLAESTWVPEQVVIDASPSEITVQVAGQENRTFSTTPGQPENVYSRSGVRASLTQVIRPDGGIEQQLRALDGTQYNFYTPQPDGRTLNLDVLIQARQLTQEIRFRIPFTRQ